MNWLKDARGGQILGLRCLDHFVGNYSSQHPERLSV